MTTHKTLYETRRKKTRRKRGRHDVVGCCRVLQLCEQLHPKKTLVGDGDEFVVVESSSKSSSKSQRRRSFHKNGRRECDRNDDDDSQVVFKILLAVVVVASRRTARVVRRAEQNERRVRSIDGIGVLSSEDVR